MPARIRLRRIGKNPKKRYFFRISVYDKRKGRDSRSIEELGFYDPTKEPALIKLNQERLQYWLSCGAEMSDAIKSLVKRFNKKPTIDIPQTDAETNPELTNTVKKE